MLSACKLKNIVKKLRALGFSIWIISTHGFIQFSYEKMLRKRRLGRFLLNEKKKTIKFRPKIFRSSNLVNGSKSSYGQ